MNMYVGVQLCGYGACVGMVRVWVIWGDALAVVGTDWSPSVLANGR
jgi:hypothetical protein